MMSSPVARIPLFIIGKATLCSNAHSDNDVHKKVLARIFAIVIVCYLSFHFGSALFGERLTFLSL